MSDLQTPSISPTRLNSIDVFRGLTVAAMLLVNNAGDWSHVYPWLEHAEWNGCTPADFVFPFFLFIVGISLELALGSKVGNVDSGILWKTACWRATKIFLLGVALHVIAMILIPDRSFRLLGVLQRIGICFCVAATILIFVRNTVTICVLVAFTLLAYWFLLHATGGYQPGSNIVDRIDTAVLGPLAYQFDPVTFKAHEPEGLLSTLPAVVNVLLGLIAGRLLRHQQQKTLIFVAVFLLLLGYLWSFWMPWNKQLWTSSFVCWTSGWAILFTVVLHYLIDQKHFSPLGLSFGINAISAYAGAWVATCVIAATNGMAYLYPQWLVLPLTKLTSEAFASFLFAFLFTLSFGGLMYGLRRRGWRFSV